MESTQLPWRQEAAESQRLCDTRTRLLHAQSRLTLLFPLIAIAALCALLWNVAARPALLAWMALVIALTLGRYRLLRRMPRASAPAGARMRWLNEFAAGALLSGFLWGAAPLLIVPDVSAGAAVGAQYQGLVMLVVCGLVAGATVTYVVSVRVWLGFTFPALIIPGLYLSLLGERLNAALGGFVLLYLFFITVAGLRMHAQLRRFIEMEYELDRLRRDLAATDGPAA